jgi:hypothetical protein
MRSLKIYSDAKYLPDGFRHCQMLYPFWGFCPLPRSSRDFRPLLDIPELNADRLAHYVERGRTL